MAEATEKPSKAHRWHLAPALAGWLLPGLGHMLIGQRQRGGILMVTLLVLWAAGLTVGGISVIDRKAHPYWFAGQMLTAPSVMVDWYHQRLKQGGPPQPPSQTGRRPAYVPSFGRVAEQGTLYVALAGLLNLVAMLDVLYRDPNDPRHRAAEAEAETEAASESEAKPSDASQAKA
jgi:hypothetical protein